MLRIKEPSLHRPFKAGNLAFAIALGVGPAALIGYALYASRDDAVKLGHGSMPALLFSLLVALLGPHPLPDHCRSPPPRPRPQRRTRRRLISSTTPGAPGLVRRGG